MEEVIKELKSHFDEDSTLNVNIPKTDIHYCRELSAVRRSKISFAIGYMFNNDKVNKQEALDIISKILFDSI